MFVLACMKQTVRILPSSFHLPLEQAIKDELNRKFANKVVLNVGLCIALWDITEQSQSFILPGDGASHTNVKFRFVVFRPFMDEILVGKIRSCSREAVHVTLGFFDEIIIPPEYLQQPARFDETEQVWVWEYETEDGKHDLFMDEGEEVRFRVMSETFVDTNPSGGEKPADASVEPGENKKIPYLLTASINEPGLGLLSWWNS